MVTLSKYSYLIEQDDPVRVIEGKYVGRVGQVLDVLFHGTKIIVDVSGQEVAYDRDQLEPLFDLEQGIELKLPEVDPGSVLADRVKSFGMSSEELAEFTGEFLVEAVARIKGTGNEQYSMDGFQRFEGRELDEVLVDIEEEALDIGNYAAMLFIRIRRLRLALDEVDDLGKGTEEEYEGGDVTADDFKEDGNG